MGSPGHRKNIVDPLADRVGVGIVGDGEDRLVITEVFAQDFVTHNTDRVARDFVSAANALRRRAGVRSLKEEPALRRIAEKSSAAMAKAGEQAPEQAQALLKEAALPYGVQIMVGRSNHPLEPASVKDIASTRYNRIGVGVAQTERKDGEKLLWTTILLGVK